MFRIIYSLNGDKMDISKIDKNFKIETKINKGDIEFYSALNEPFSVHGLIYTGGKFRRMDEDVAKRVSPGVYSLHTNTAGGRVRFNTDSSYVAIYAKMENVGKMPHFALSGSSGFDLYVLKKYHATFMPPYEMTNGYEAVCELGERKMREITINFPLYSDVCELYIGVSDSARILPAREYKINKPIVFYGSSITQGGCASRPGASYEAIASRTLDAEYLNLGFSGNARAEDEMINYIKMLDMSAFVYDYDHNAPTREHLEATHEKMFLKIREAHPKIPILILPRPKYYLSEDEKKRLEIIKRTYHNALLRGDKNVYFIDGKGLLGSVRDEGTVDGCHPTDLGFYQMAQAVNGLLKKIL